MAEEQDILITGIERLDGTSIVVNFSDNTSAQYTLQELLKSRPQRQSADETSDASVAGGE